MDIQVGDWVEVVEIGFYAGHPTEERPIRAGDQLKVAIISDGRISYLIKVNTSEQCYQTIFLSCVRKVEGSTSACTCPTLQLMIKGCTCGGS